MKSTHPLLAFIPLVLQAQTTATLSYPAAPKGSQVDDYHGTKIADPYRGLEDADAPATRKWVEQENQLTFSYLNRLPGRDAIKKQLTGLWSYEKFERLFKAGPHYFYFHNDGLQNQSVLDVMASLNGEPRVLIDPNTYRKDGTAALGGGSVSWDGKLYAYSVAQAGSDWAEWHVREVETGKDLPDLIRWTKGTGAAWTQDNKGFYYSRYPEPAPEKVLTAAALDQKVYFHKLGTEQSSDALVYARPDHPNWGLHARMLEGGRYLMLEIYTGFPGKNLLAYRDLNAADPRTVDLVSSLQAAYDPIANAGTTLYLLTTDGAPRGRVIAMDLNHPERERWKEVVPEGPETLEDVHMADGKLLLDYMKDAHSAARLVDLDGKRIADLGAGAVADVTMPGLGTASWSPARLQDTEMFYGFSGFTTPPGVYRLDLKTGKSTVVRESKVAFDASRFETQQVFYPSKDGTRVPMFLSFRKGLKRDGRKAALLYGYGGFAISETPRFTPAVMEWLEMGGVYASAVLRGGGEFGETWHEAGMRAKKQNVFDDFIAAAEWLIANEYTSTPKLAIMGGSNGGLLVGAVLNQRPDLFGAAMPAVGVMDMLRFQKFGFGTQWVGEYGSAENAEDLPVLRAYSPLHNIRKGVRYPPTLITTADHDDRVMPGHSLKYAATLQQAQEGPAPVLIRVETRAGHGAGMPTSKRIDEWVDRFVFLKSALGME
ncbi:MAG: prolyl oligopeptidase family serine peptidase [Acidobacteriota bacterium]|nr:prolyl oligopeptidase family serine peptidase [Acidobacteriota bacterium]